MKILHVVPSYIPAYRYGGAVNAVHELCVSLVRKGVDVSVFTTNIDFEKSSKVRLGAYQIIDGVRVLYHPVAFPRAYCYSPSLYSSLAKDLPGFDAVHIHSVYLYPTNVCAKLCRRYQKPYLLNPFGAIDPSMIRLKGYFKKSSYIKFVEKNNIMNAAAIHVASEYERDAFRSAGFNAHTVIIPPSINIESYKPPEKRRSLSDIYPALKDKKVILFLGRIHPKKGLKLLAEALGKVIAVRKDVFLAVAGDGQNKYVKSVREMFSRHGLDGHVIFTGFIIGKDRLSLLHGSDIFILPSYGENFGIAVQEAMACGLSVIVTDRVGLARDVEKNRAGLVTDLDPAEIAEAIIRLLRDESLRRQMGENGRTFVEKNFSMETISEKMINIYEGIIKTANS